MISVRMSIPKDCLSMSQRKEKPAWQDNYTFDRFSRLVKEKLSSFRSIVP